MLVVQRGSDDWVLKLFARDSRLSMETEVCGVMVGTMAYGDD